MIGQRGGASTDVPFDLTWHNDVPHQRLLIHAGRFWKGEGPDEQTDVDILVVDNRIESVLPHDAGHDYHADRVVDATQYTVLPGLWENHAHPSCLQSIYYGDRMGRLWLSYGITELRDLADPSLSRRRAARILRFRSTRRTAAFPDRRSHRWRARLLQHDDSHHQRRAVASRARAPEGFRLRSGEALRAPALRVAGAGQNLRTSRWAWRRLRIICLPAVALGNDMMSHISATSRTGYAYSRSFTGVTYEDVEKMLAEFGNGHHQHDLQSGAVYAEDPGLATNSRSALYPPWERERLTKAVDTALHEDQRTALLRLAA